MLAFIYRSSPYTRKEKHNAKIPVALNYDSRISDSQYVLVGDTASEM